MDVLKFTQRYFGDPAFCGMFRLRRLCKTVGVLILYFLCINRYLHKSYSVRHLWCRFQGTASILRRIILYIKVKVCLFYPTQIHIHISQPIWTKLCTHLPLGLEETVGYVWIHNIWLFDFFDLFCRERVPNPGQKMAAGARVIRVSVISVIPARVGVTSQTWRYSSRLLHVLTEVSCTVGNAWTTRRSERNACV